MIDEDWDGAIAALGGTPTGGADLVARYAEPHRHHHTADHVRAVLTAAERPAASLPAQERHLLALAICAHDVVYEGAAGEDERASAAWAAETLTRAGLARDLITRVQTLVLATITHEPEDDLEAILLDADLAVLAADASTYDAYARAVRREYARYDDEAWASGRARVLRALLTRPRIYTRAAELERRARHNLRAELATLAPGARAEPGPGLERPARGA